MKTISGTTRLGAYTVMTLFSFAANCAEALDFSPTTAGAAIAIRPAELTAAPQGKELTDGKILKVLLTIDNNEISVSAFALRKTPTPAVKEFAQQMMEEHGRMNESVSALGQSTQIEAVDAPIAASLRDQGQSDLKELSLLAETKNFDVAFLQKQVVAHQMALKMLSETLLPNASNPTLKMLVSKAQPIVQHHLEMAEKLLTDLR